MFFIDAIGEKKWISLSEEEKKLTAIEVKSGRRRDGLPGLKAFGNDYPAAKELLVGGDGIPEEEFLLTPVDRWL